LKNKPIFQFTKRLALQCIALAAAVAGLATGSAVFAADDQAAVPSASANMSIINDAPPKAPGIANPTQADDAEIFIHSKDANVDRLIAAPSSTPVTIDGPVVFYIQRAPGSMANRYVYALVRDGNTVVSSDRPLGLSTNLIKLQHRSETTPGLRAGPVTLYVWGIDQINRISAAKRLDLMISGQD